jgi:hypothetical protein
MEHYIPQNNNGKLGWARNFRAKIGEIGAILELGEERIAEAIAACDTIIFSITLAQFARIFSKVCTGFRNESLKSKTKKPQHVPHFQMPEVPEKLLPFDAVTYLERLAAEMKLNRKYASFMGANLKIITPAKAALRDDVTPKAKLKQLDNSAVWIGWKKLGRDGVIVESKRGDEQNWTEIGRDLVSPFIDTRKPLVVGQPEIRYYRLIYMIDDEPFGLYSPTYQTVTNPR